VLNHIETEEDKLMARLASNVCRRRVSALEKRSILADLGEIYLRKGVKPGKIAHEIAKKTGMSYRWVMKYLPDKFKERPGIGGPSRAWNLYDYQDNVDKSKVAWFATSESMHKKKDVVLIKNYINRDFVAILLSKHVYAKYEEIAEDLKVPTESLISEVLLTGLRKKRQLMSAKIPAA